MSLPLKPLTIDSNSRQLDSKQKKFNATVVRALEHFDSVTEWADYIASLGKLLKALQSWSPQFQNVKYYVPSPYQVSRRLTSSLSPNLPAGVHQKTLEVYTFIFEKIGPDILASECNIWVPGILPLMSYASMSVKSHLIELYDSYLVQLPSSTLKLLIKPLLSSLFPGIDDESSEFQPLTMKLIETLKENLADDSLFWQSCFLVMITNKDRRLGGLVWLTKKLPTLNSVPHLVAQRELESHNKDKNASTVDTRQLRDEAFATLLPVAKDLLSPEPGLLIRCLACCLNDDNDLLIKRGVWDLLLQRLHLDSPVLETLVSPSDKQMLIMSCCKTTLEKDMSLNRRIWNWLLGPAVAALSNSNNLSGNDIEKEDKSDENKSNYFSTHGLMTLLEGLNEMIEKESSVTSAFNICLAVMDRWEIGTLVIPEMFIPLLSATQKFIMDSQILKTANIFFDTVETNIIWGKIFQYIMETGNLGFLSFVLSTFNINAEEEIIVRHLPLILLAILHFEKNVDGESVKDGVDRYFLCRQLLNIIPERAFLPLDSSQLKLGDDSCTRDVLDRIFDFYSRVSDPALSQVAEDSVDLSSPFSPQDLTFLIISKAHDILIHSMEADEYLNEVARIFVMITEKIPSNRDDSGVHASNWSDDRLIEIVFMRSEITSKKQSESAFGIVDIFSGYLSSRMSLLQSNKLIQLIIESLWKFLVDPHRQLKAVKCLESLERCMSPLYIEGALSHAFVQEQDISRSLIVLELLWIHLEPRSVLTMRPLELMIDQLFGEENPHYLSVSKWILSVNNAGSSNRLFYFLTDKLLQFDFLGRDHLNDLDDLDMFTYRIRSLTSVLKTNNGIIIKSFSAELTSIDSLAIWGSEDISTYKNLVLAIVFRFLEIKNNNHATSIRSALILLECLLNGTERNFKEIVISLLQKSSKYISRGGLESELIAVSLLNIVSKVLRLSHENGIKLDIFDDSSTHLKYIDYLVTSVSTMEGPLIVTSYIKLLSESMIYFENAMFRMILPLSASMVQCVQRLLIKEKESGGYYQSISLLLNGLQELLEVSHGFLVTDEKDGYFSSNGSKGDFLQSMVSNVFSTDSSVSDTKTQGERDVVLQSFNQAVNCCFEIWSWAHGLAVNIESTADQTNHNSYKFKFTAKRIMEKLFSLEPLEVMEDLVAIPSNNTLSLIHVLDGNRPALTIPYFFLGVIHRQNRTASVKLSIHGNMNTSGNSKTGRMESSLINRLDSQALMRFLITYTASVENAAIEDFYVDFSFFFKEVSTNYNLYEPISKSVLRFIAIVAQKVSKSKFGEQKRIRRELSDTFVKYLPSALGDSPFDYEDPSQSFSDLKHVVINLQHITNDNIGGDKFNSCIAIIVAQCITPFIKGKNLSIPEYVLGLALEIAKVGGKVKNWRSLINEFYLDDRKFCSLSDNVLWEEIISEWAQYPENKFKLLNDLLSMIGSRVTSITPALITFNSWNDTENEVKCQNLLRISYLLMVSPVDVYLLQFQSLISCACQYLVSKNVKLKEKSWILLRVMFLRFKVSHFEEYWSMITYCLQTNLQEFCESLQIQEEVNAQLVLQTCKTLDLLLALNFEGFSATNGWLFVIDSINCIYKTYPFMSLIDEIYECKEFEMAKTDEIELVDRVQLKTPLLNGVHVIQNYIQLRNFFQNLSYAHYEYVFSLEELDLKGCETDLYLDIFA